MFGNMNRKPENHNKLLIFFKIAQLFKPIFLYFAVALCAAVTNIALFWLLTTIQINVLAATVISSFCGSCVNFAVGRITLFRKAARQGKGALADFTGVIMASAVGYGLDVLFIWLMVKKLALLPVPSKIISTGLVFVWNFSAQKFVVYNRRKIKE